MLHLIADFTLIVTEGGREDSKDGRDGVAGRNMGKLRQRNLFVKNAPLTQEELLNEQT